MSRPAQQMAASLLIDSHCHLNNLSPISEIASVIAKSRQVGVAGWLIPGVAPDDWGVIRQLALTFSGVLPAYGTHPLWADRWDNDADVELRRLAADAVAIGEIGLDFFRGISTRGNQRLAIYSCFNPRRLGYVLLV